MKLYEGDSHFLLVTSLIRSGSGVSSFLAELLSSNITNQAVHIYEQYPACHAADVSQASMQEMGGMPSHCMLHAKTAHAP